MHFPLLVKGLIAGIAIAAPVGPTTALVVHRAVQRSFKDGLLSGLGAAMADSLFGLLSAFGAGLLLNFIAPHTLFIRAVGGGFLVYWGYHIFISHFTETHPLVKDKGLGGPLASAFILTLTNPLTLLAFAGVLIGVKSAAIHSHLSQLLEWMAGIALGSFAWWLLVNCAAFVFRNKFDGRMLKILNRIIGVLVMAAGIVAWFLLFRTLFLGSRPWFDLVKFSLRDFPFLN